MRKPELKQEQISTDEMSILHQIGTGQTVVEGREISFIILEHMKVKSADDRRLKLVLAMTNEDVIEVIDVLTAFVESKMGSDVLPVKQFVLHRKPLETVARTVVQTALSLPTYTSDTEAEWNMGITKLLLQISGMKSILDGHKEMDDDVQ